MIGNVRREIKVQPLYNTKCGHCEQSNALLARVYCKMFLLKVLPFATGKEMAVECTACKKAYVNEWDMPPHIWDSANAVKQDTKQPWFAYIGYAFIGMAFIIGIVKK